MLIKESEMKPQANILEQLDQAVYLTQEEAEFGVADIPVLERHGSYYFDQAYMDRFFENGKPIPTYQDIAEANDIDCDKIISVVDEATVLSNPEKLTGNFIVSPIRESSLEYQYVSECIDKWSTTSDESYLDAIVEDTYLNEFVDKVKDFYVGDFKRSNRSAELAKFNIDSHLKYINGSNNEISNYNKILKDPNSSDKEKELAKSQIERVKEEQKKNTKIDRTLIRGHEKDAVKYAAKGAGKVALTGLAVYGGYKGLQKLVQTAKERPKSWIGKKIAALRNIYSKWMNAAEHTANKSNSSMIKNAASKILTVIDKLLAILQKHAG